MSGQELADAFHQSVGCGHIIQAEIAVQAIQADIPGDFQLGEDTFQFRAKIEFALMPAVIQRLDAHAVARKNEPPL